MEKIESLSIHLKTIKRLKNIWIVNVEDFYDKTLKDLLEVEGIPSTQLDLLLDELKERGIILA